MVIHTMTNLDGHLDFGSIQVTGLLDLGPVGVVWGHITSCVTAT